MEVMQNINPEVSLDDAKRLLGIRKNSTLSIKMQRKLDRYRKRIEEIMAPVLLYTTRDIEKVDNERVLICNHLFFKSKNLAISLKGSQKLVVFIGTIGQPVDIEVKGLMEQGKIVDAYVLDTMGSVAVEGVVDGFQRDYETKLVSERKRTTLKFSPGYCDWDLKEQRKIFSILDSNSIGVRLKPKFKMEPSKTISGVFGVGDTDTLGEKPFNPCKVCTMKNCIARR
ncbi:MAG: hypothetical protein SWO11_12685 [Thermodesulfobacteriota bacterium]|nr:hypothetical protein [Thermodesulfobacteriota bacterium]